MKLKIMKNGFLQAGINFRGCGEMDLIKEELKQSRERLALLWDKFGWAVDDEIDTVIYELKAEEERGKMLRNKLREGDNNG